MNGRIKQRLVQIRLIGLPDDVTAVAEGLAHLLGAVPSGRSKRPSKYNPQQVISDLVIMIEEEARPDGR